MNDSRREKKPLFGKVEPLERVAQALGAAPSDETLGNLATWARLAAEWNRRVDLTAARDDDELADLLLADAIILARSVVEGARVVDVGSGVGAPGLGLALLRPDLRLTLVEPLRKRAAFLRTVLGTIGNLHVTIVDRRVEQLGDGTAPFDAAMARAVFSPVEWLRVGNALVGPRGKVYVFLARDAPPAPGPFAFDATYAWPHTSAQRRIVAYEY